MRRRSHVHSLTKHIRTSYYDTSKHELPFTLWVSPFVERQELQFPVRPLTVGRALVVSVTKAEQLGHVDRSWSLVINSENQKNSICTEVSFLSIIETKTTNNSSALMW